MSFSEHKIVSIVVSISYFLNSLMEVLLAFSVSSLTLFRAELSYVAQELQPWIFSPILPPREHYV
jgi:hypothetical protein